MLFEIRDLRVNYAGAEVLKGISLELEQGEIVTLIGNNGAGKTTTLRAISGLKTAASGEIWFEGRRIDRMLPQDIVRIGISHVPQERGLFPYMSVSENIRLGAFLRKDKDEINKDLERLLEHFSVLKERKRQQASTLSGGEQQMLAIACALMGNPKLLLLDEPTIALDKKGRRILLELVETAKENGNTVILATNDPRIVTSLDRLVVIENGDICLDGPPREVLYKLEKHSNLIPNQTVRYIQKLEKEIGISLPRILNPKEFTCLLKEDE